MTLVVVYGNVTFDTGDVCRTWRCLGTLIVVYRNVAFDIGDVCHTWRLGILTRRVLSHRWRLFGRSWDRLDPLHDTLIIWVDLIAVS